MTDSKIQSGQKFALMLQRVEMKLNNVLGIMVGLLILTSALLAFGSVVLRYSFGVSYGLIEELCRYIIVYAVMLYFGPLITRNAHLTMSFLPDMLSVAWRRQLDLGLYVLLSLLLLVLTIAALQWEFGLYDMNLLTMSGSLRAYVPSAALPLGVGLALVYAVMRVIYRVSGVPLNASEATS